LFALAKAFAEQDPDRNGEKDTYGMAISSSNSERTIKQMFQSVDFIVRDGKVEYPWDNIGETASFLKRLYDEGIVDKDFLTDSNGEKAKQDFVNGKIGIYPTQVNWTSFAKNEYKTLKENVPDAELIAIALPESPAGSFIPTLTNPVQMTAAVNRAAKHPEAVIEFADFLATPTTGNTLVFGLEGEHHELGANGCPSILDGDQKEQIGYMADMTMLTSSPYVLNGTCGIETQFDLTDPYGAEVLELFKQAKSIYLDLSRPYPELTISEHMPQMPKDLQITMNETYKTVGDLFQKSLVGGSKYTVEQMLMDAQGVWQNGKGPDAEAWINKWYAEQKDNAFMPEDLYEIVKQQEGK
jgi:putative aldouronate transport system substrate-binding protein